MVVPIRRLKNRGVRPVVQSNLAIDGLRSIHSLVLGENWIRSAVREFVVLRDRPLQIVAFIAGDETDLLESGEMLFGFRQITLGQMGFTEVFVCAAVPRI